MICSSYADSMRGSDRVSHQHVCANRYDTLDQAKLHDADKKFLNCLQNIPESEKITSLGQTYRNLYVLGKYLI